MTTIHYKGRAAKSGCVTWNENTLAMEVQPCAAKDGSSWTNATAHSCQQWDVIATHGATTAAAAAADDDDDDDDADDDGATTAAYSFGPIHGAPGCTDNEGRPGPPGCLDIHSKVGPSLQFTKCYGQANDNFTIAADGFWRSADAPPTYPQRCMAVSSTPEVCPFAGCCTECAPGRRFNTDGFCVPAAPSPAPSPATTPRKAYVWLAADTNATGDAEAIEALVPFADSFTGVVFQYWSICGAGAANHTCHPDDSVGPARLRPTWDGRSSPPAALAAQLRSKLGADKDMVAAISFGGSQSNAILVELFRNGTLTDQFIRDAIRGCKAQGLTGVNFDLEPFGTGADGWFADAARFFGPFSAALRSEGLTVGWDSNGPEGVFLDVDTWMAMNTYDYEPGPDTGFPAYLRKGVFAVGQERFAVGLCPTCTPQNETVVEGFFAELRRPGGPGPLVRKMQLFSFYGVGEQPPSGWGPFWPRVKAWLQGGGD